MIINIMKNQKEIYEEIDRIIKSMKRNTNDFRTNAYHYKIKDAKDTLKKFRKLLGNFRREFNRLIEEMGVNNKRLFAEIRKNRLKIQGFEKVIENINRINSQSELKELCENKKIMKQISTGLNKHNAKLWQFFEGELKKRNPKDPIKLRGTIINIIDAQIRQLINYIVKIITEDEDGYEEYMKKLENIS